MRIISIIIIVLLLTAPLFAGETDSSRPMVAEDVLVKDFVPQPRLLQPTTEEVDLAGKRVLNFSWSPHEGDIMQRVYYDFRIYKGYETVESNLIYNKEVPPNIYNIDVSSGMFETGKIYTWSVRQAYNNSKSHRSYSSFKVKGK